MDVDANGGVEVGSFQAGAITSAAFATDAIGSAALAASAVTEIVNGVWDEPMAGHVTADSFGLAARVLRANTAQAGAAGSITLDASAPATDGLYTGCWIALVNDTGAGQVRLITGYTGATKVATVTPNWVTNPASGTEFVIVPAGRVDLALWLGSAPNALAAGRVDSTVGAMQADVVTAGAIATDAIGANEFSQAAADKVWAAATRTLSAFGFSVTVGTNNDKTGYTLSAAGVQAIWDALTSALTTANSIGKRLADNIDATISSRSSHTAADVWAAATRTLTAIGAGVLNSAARNEIADSLLDRDMAAGTDSGSTTVRTVRQALRFLRNRWFISGGTLTVTTEDDATTSWTGAVTQTAGNPVSEINPAGP
jgi:hypothetical protein